MPTAAPLPPCDYLALVSRASRRPTAEVWPVTIRQRLPVIPIPLAAPDPDVLLDLQAALDQVYDRAGYDYSLDYTAPLVIPLPPEETAWLTGVLEARNRTSGC